MKQHRAKFKTFTYLLNIETGYFEKQPTEFTFKKMPYELKKEIAQKAYLKNRGANILLRSRQVNGKHIFHTGLIPLEKNNFYQGNYYERYKGKKKLSLIIFELVELTQIRVYFFNHYYIDAPKERAKFCNQFAQNLG